MGISPFSMLSPFVSFFSYISSSSGALSDKGTEDLNKSNPRVDCTLIIHRQKQQQKSFQMTCFVGEVVPSSDSEQDNLVRLLEFYTMKLKGHFC